MIRAFGRSRYEMGLPPVELWGVATKDPTHRKAWDPKKRRMVLVPLKKDERVAA